MSQCCLVRVVALRRAALAVEWGLANRAQGKGGGETEDYGSLLGELGNKTTRDMLFSPGERRCLECQDYVNKCLIIVIKCIHRKFEVWSGQQIRTKIVIEKTVSHSSQEEGVCHIGGGGGAGGHLEKN